MKDRYDALRKQWLTYAVNAKGSSGLGFSDDEIADIIQRLLGVEGDAVLRPAKAKPVQVGISFPESPSTMTILSDTTQTEHDSTRSYKDTEAASSLDDRLEHEQERRLTLLRRLEADPNVYVAFRRTCKALLKKDPNITVSSKDISDKLRARGIQLSTEIGLLMIRLFGKEYPAYDKRLRYQSSAIDLDLYEPNLMARISKVLAATAERILSPLEMLEQLIAYFGTMEAVAAALPISDSSVRNWMNGRNGISPQNAEKIERLYYRVIDID